MTSTTQIISQLKAVSDTERKERSEIMLPSSMTVLGTRAPKIKMVVDECWTDMKNCPPSVLLNFAKELVKTKILECN